MVGKSCPEWARYLFRISSDSCLRSSLHRSDCGITSFLGRGSRVNIHVKPNCVVILSILILVAKAAQESARWTSLMDQLDGQA